MIVKDIYESTKAISCFTDQARNFELITDAVDILGNKGDFDISLEYLDIAIPSTGVITLPREVKTPIEVNVDDNPAFSRDRLYEFTLNGPGSNTERVGWSWEDRGNVPVFIQPTATSKLYASCQTADIGKQITVYGRDENGQEVRSDIIMNLAHHGDDSVPTFVSITKVAKDATVDEVGLHMSTDGTLLSTYAPDETEPSYRQIKISKSTGTAHILFKRNVFPVSSMYDFLPIRSKRAMQYMVKALKHYNADNPTLGKQFEDTAVNFANEEQKSHNAFIELANATQIQTIRNLGINNRDSVIVADIWDDASKIFGFVGTETLYDSITEAVELLANTGQWDGLIGWVDILTDQFHYVTLPRYVETPLAINISGQPAEFKNKWFQFHLNGPGSNWQPCRSFEDAGDVVTFRDVNYPLQLTAIPDLALDNGLEMRCYGTYQGKRIMTPDSTGQMVDGFPINCSVSGAVAPLQFVDRIERITKAPSKGFVKLLGFDSTQNLQVVIGYYWPDETEPSYKRIRLAQQSVTVRMKYRKRTLKVSSLTDPLHLKSRQAIIRSMNAIALMDKKDYPNSKIELEMAKQFLTDEQSSRNPLEQPEVQFSPTMVNRYYHT